jgi:hypothetical protein
VTDAVSRRGWTAMPEKFSLPRPNLIESDAGFSVEVLGRTGMKYVEQGKTMSIYTEVLATPGAMVLYGSSLKGWEPPHDLVALNNNDRERIIGNIRRAFAFQGYRLDVGGRFPIDHDD